MVASAKFRGPRVARTAQAGAELKRPEDIEAEEALLGSLLIDPEALAELQNEIPNFHPAHFVREAHKDIYQAILDLQKAGEPADLITVAGWLTDHRKQQEWNSPAAYLHGLTMAVPTSANLIFYARRVYNKARQWAQIGLTCDLLTAACNGDDEAFNKAISKAEQLKEDYIPLAARPLKIKSLREIMQTEYPEVRMLLEKLIQQGGVTILAGKPKAWKSFFVLAAAFAIAQGVQHAFSAPGMQACIPSKAMCCIWRWRIPSGASRTER